MAVKNSVATNIQFGNLTYPLWDAAITAGAGLDELVRLDEGKYPKWFMVKLLAWKAMHDLVAMHSEDAVSRAIDRKSRKKR